MSYHFVPESNPLPVPTNQQLNVPTNLGQIVDWKRMGYTAEELRRAGNKVGVDGNIPRIKDWTRYRKSKANKGLQTFSDGEKIDLGVEVPEYCTEKIETGKKSLFWWQNSIRVLRPEYENEILCNPKFYSDGVFYGDVLTTYYLWLDADQYKKGRPWTERELKQQGRSPESPYHPNNIGSLTGRQTGAFGKLPQIPDSIVIELVFHL
jgi:hypothetical protein